LKGRNGLGCFGIWALINFEPTWWHCHYERKEMQNYAIRNTGQNKIEMNQWPT
jgi:hypothetical protein